MGASTGVNQCILLNIAIIAKASQCMYIIRSLRDSIPTRFRLKLVALVAVTQSPACYKYAGEMGIEIFENHLDLLTMENLDFILELTGDQKILTELVNRKSPTTGILDRQASTFFIELALVYGWVDSRETENTQTASFASALLEASPDGVMVIDRSYKIVRSNDSPILTYGWMRGTIVGNYCYEVIQWCTKKNCMHTHRGCPVKQTFETGKSARMVHEIAGPNGEMKISQVTTYPIFNQLKEISQLVVTVRDITSDLSERIEARTKVIKSDLARLVQEDRLSSLGRIVASVCHEINNPIASIVTFNKLILSHIQGNTMPAEGIGAFKRYLELSVREALRCGSIVNNLLSFAREKSVKADEIDLIDLINTIMILTSHQMQLCGVEYTVNLPQRPFTAWGDNAQIQQCLMNLVFNAIEAMPEGGELTIDGGRDEEDENFIWITVTDSGHGISSEDLTLIFEPFYSTKSDGKGVGLGLSMLYGIIREHNGSVEVNSSPENGTVFKIKLPRTDLSEKGVSQ